MSYFSKTGIFEQFPCTFQGKFALVYTTFIRMNFGPVVATVKNFGIVDINFILRISTFSCHPKWRVTFELRRNSVSKFVSGLWQILPFFSGWTMARKI
ncbi:GSCOCG00007362001-RA-CDS [Cotesia congregata]|nr:GSCOCG00007362001-RA-CDS [Cotesia congregata]